MLALESLLLGWLFKMKAIRMSEYSIAAEIAKMFWSLGVSEEYMGGPIPPLSVFVASYEDEMHQRVRTARRSSIRRHSSW